MFQQARLFKLIVMLVFLWGSLPLVPVSGASNGWIFTNIATVGADGFTDIALTARIGDNGTVVIRGTRNGANGLFKIQAGNVIDVATVGLLLPGSLGTISSITDFVVDPSGRVLFKASVTGANPAVSGDRVYRWENGVISRMLPDDSSQFVHDLRALTSDGRWMVNRTTGTPSSGVQEFYLTDGINPTLMLTTNTSNVNCVSTGVNYAMADVNGNLFYYEVTQQNTFNGITCVRPTNITWNIMKKTAAVSGVVAGGTAVFGQNGVMEGSMLRDSGIRPFLVNNQGDVVYKRAVRNAGDPSDTPLVQVVKVSAGTEQILNDEGGSQFVTITPISLDNAGRIAVAGQLNTFQTGVFASANSADGILVSGHTLFNQIVTVLSAAGNTPPGTFGDSRSFVIYYRLADGTEGIVQASKGVARWNNPLGGSWAAAVNWDPAEVPGSASEILFDLEASYDVNVGTPTVGRVRIENGSVGFTNGTLSLLGPLTVGGDASFTLPSGTLTTGEMMIGSLPSIDPLNPPVARMFVSNQNTLINGLPVVTVGDAGAGDVLLSDAQILGGPLTIGKNSPGNVVVTGANGRWETGAMAVGFDSTGMLTVERGGFVRTFGDVVIGHGTTLQETVAVVNISNQGVPQAPLTNWLIGGGTTTLGGNQRGEIYISNGGTVGIGQGVLQAGLNPHASSGFDGYIDINGSGDVAGGQSELTVFEDVLLGMANGTIIGVNVTNGGKLYAGSNIYLAHETGSQTRMTVSGINAHAVPAMLEVPGRVGNFLIGYCSVGEGGQATLLIQNGGQVFCGSGVRIGGLPGSIGKVVVDGANGSTLTTDGGLCIGGDLVNLCGASQSGQQGTLELRNSGSVTAGRGTLVGPGGRVTGSGDLAVGVLGFDLASGAVLDPGVNILEPFQLFSANNAVSPNAVSIGSLSVHPVAPATSASVTVAPGAQIVIDVKSLTQLDRFIVDGDVNLAGGTLKLAFSNGFAPKQGETFAFLQANNILGSFSSIEITGLAPGFLYDLNLVNGSLQLHALNDGVPTTNPVFIVYLPMMKR